VDPRIGEEVNRLHFDQCDPEGFIFFGQAFTIAHRKVEEIVSQSPMGWSYFYRNPDWAAPIRHTEAEYLAPLVANDTYAVDVRVSRIGKTSFQWVVTFSKESKNCIIVKMTHALLNRVLNSKQELPTELRSFLEKINND
jgi:acyl-CoA thioesterase FadM